MVTINLERVSKTRKKQLRLDELNLTIEPAMISAICTNERESATVLFDLINGAKPDDGRVLLDRMNAYRERKQLAMMVGCLYMDENFIKKGTVKDYLKGQLQFASGSRLSLAQAVSVAEQLRLSGTTRMSDLDLGTQRQLKILALVACEYPILLLDQPTLGMTEEQSVAIWQLLIDYRQKMAATVIFYSSSVAEMQGYADQIIYLANGHVSHIRPISTHDSSDCVVRVTGQGLPVEMVDALGGHFVEETPVKQEFLFTGSIQALLPLLEQSGITNVRITDATIDDELMVW